jgi:hypothetical protein
MGGAGRGRHLGQLSGGEDRQRSAHGQAVPEAAGHPEALQPAQRPGSD